MYKAFCDWCGKEEDNPLTLTFHIDTQMLRGINNKEELYEVVGRLPIKHLCTDCREKFEDLINNIFNKKYDVMFNADGVKPKSKTPEDVLNGQ